MCSRLPECIVFALFWAAVYWMANISLARNHQFCSHNLVIVVLLSVVLVLKMASENLVRFYSKDLGAKREKANGGGLVSGARRQLHLATSVFLLLLTSLWITLFVATIDATSVVERDIKSISSRELEKKILDEILGEGYDKRIRPGGFNNKTDGPVVVRENTLIRGISKVDDMAMEYSVQLSLRQEWLDERLAFKELNFYKNYNININSITLTEHERLWKPDLFFRNEKWGHFHHIIMPNVLLRINGDGVVLYSLRISLVLACPMDLKYYPMDKQNCTIEMASYGYRDEDLRLIWKENNPVQVTRPLTLPRFNLETLDTAFCTSRTTTGAYSCLRVDLIFKRDFSHHLNQIYIPCCVLVVVSWLSFWLEPSAITARVLLLLITLLSMGRQISSLNASLPLVSYTMAIDVWTSICLAFVFGALLEFGLVNYFARNQPKHDDTLAPIQAEGDKWRIDVISRCLFPIMFALFNLVYWNAYLYRSD